MEIHNIKDVSDSILNKLDIMTNRDCQPGVFKLKELRDHHSKNTDILYIIEDDTPIYFLLLDLYPKHKTVYIHDVCVNKNQRGKGTFKKSLEFLKDHYAKKGYKSFTLDASDSEKEAHLNQKSRIHIFHSAGFDINTETGYFENSTDYKIIKTRLLLSNNDKVTVQKKRGLKYQVRNKTGKNYYTTIDQVEKCYNAKDKQISCPMIMQIKRKRHTLKHII